MESWTLSPAEDLGGRQNLSVTVPHRCSRSFAAAQTTQEAGRCFLLACRFPPGASLCQVLLRSVPAHGLDVASLFFIIIPTALPSDLFVSVVLFAWGDGEAHGLHAVDLHKRQVKLREAWERERDWVKWCLNLNWSSFCFDVKVPRYLVLRARVPVEELEESQRVSVPHQDEVPCSVRQVSRGREAHGTPGTRAGHTSERHTPEPALHAHPLTWRDRERETRCYIEKNIPTDDSLSTILVCLHVLARHAHFTAHHFLKQTILVWIAGGVYFFFLYFKFALLWLFDHWSRCFNCNTTNTKITFFKLDYINCDLLPISIKFQNSASRLKTYLNEKLKLEKTTLCFTKGQNCKTVCPNLKVGTPPRCHKINLRGCEMLNRRAENIYFKNCYKGFYFLLLFLRSTASCHLFGPVYIVQIKQS